MLLNYQRDQQVVSSRL